MHEWFGKAMYATQHRCMALKIGIMCILCIPHRCIGWHIDRHLTDVLVDISAKCLPICRSTYRPILGDIKTKICQSTYRPMYQPRYLPSDGRHIDQLSADISVNIAADTWPIYWPLIVSGISVDCRWYIGQKFTLSVSDVKVIRISSFFGQPQKFPKALCLAFMCRKFSCPHRSSVGRYGNRYIGQGVHKIHMIPKLMCPRWNWFIRITIINSTKHWCIHSSKFCSQKSPIQNSVFSMLTLECDYRAVFTAGEKLPIHSHCQPKFSSCVQEIPSMS